MSYLRVISTTNRLNKYKVACNKSRAQISFLPVRSIEMLLKYIRLWYWSKTLKCRPHYVIFLGIKSRCSVMIIISKRLIAITFITDSRKIRLNHLTFNCVSDENTSYHFVSIHICKSTWNLINFLFKLLFLTSYLPSTKICDVSGSFSFQVLVSYPSRS